MQIELKRPNGKGVWMELPGLPADYGLIGVKLDIEDSENWDKTYISDFSPPIDVAKRYLVGKTMDKDISKDDLEKIYYAVSEMYLEIKDKKLSGNPKSLDELLDIIYLKNEENQKNAERNDIMGNIEVKIKRPQGQGVWMVLPGGPASYGDVGCMLDMQDSKHWDVNIIADFHPDIKVVKLFLLGKIIDIDISPKDLEQISFAVSEMYLEIKDKELSGNPKSLDELLDIIYLKNEELQEESELLYGNKDAIGIYQVKSICGKEYRFTNMKELEKANLKIKRENYRLVYTTSNEPIDDLDKIYEKFNLDIPKDYTGHSLSVSDIVTVNKSGKVSAYFVDSFGFKEVPMFIQQAMNSNNYNLQEHGNDEISMS